MYDETRVIPPTNVEARVLALQAAAAVPTPELTSVQIESSGRVLVYGRDESALEAGRLLKDYLDVTVLIRPPAVMADQGAIDFPVWTGRITAAKGHLGSFDLAVDDFAEVAL